MNSSVHPIVWHGGRLRLLDQRRLPHETAFHDYDSAAGVADAIRSMIVRGAPAIGLCAAYGLALEVLRFTARTPAEIRRQLAEAAALLRASRPTAVNLGWAIDRMMSRAADAIDAGAEGPELAQTMVAEANAIFTEDLAANRRIGALGSELLRDGATVLTHCNAGALATSGYGTALGVIRGAVARGKKIAVFADETRPYLQGARLTAWELQQDGIDVTLITDNMSGHFFQKGTFDAVVVGADRIAANGDTANKIGTYMVAVLARRHNVPFYVAAPFSTVDLACPDGDAIPIEERSAAEVLEATGVDDDGVVRRVLIAPRDLPARHPAFDVTPAELVTAIITERGIARPPFARSLRELSETEDGS
jgi:methylthioribose-1-phosphate isomerase